MLNNQKRITRAILVCSTLTLSAFLLVLSAGKWPWATVQAAVFQLSGKVSDQSGTGLLNARLDVIDPANNNVVATTNTGAGGNYSLMINGGTYNLRVTPPTGSGLQSAVILNRVISGDTTIDFTLVPVTGVVTLSGKVTGPLGNPLAGITVDLGSFIMTTTNASGNYNLTTASGNYPVKVRGGDSTGAQHLPSGFDFETNTSFALTQNTTLDIPLNFTKQVTVHVQDPQGNPVANAVVNTGSSPYNFNLSIGSLPAHGRSEYYDGAAVTNVTNSNGDALLWLFPAQGYSLTAKPPNGAPFGLASVSGINITGDASLTITLVPLVTLSGKVTGPLGNPLAGITVDLGSFIMTTTNASGDYSLSTPAANYPVKVRGGDSTGAQHLPSGFDMQTLSNFALTQNTTLDIPLNFTKQVTVHVQDPQGNPVANAVVNTGSSPYNNNLSIGSLPAQGRSEYYDGGAVTNVTNAAGDALLWLFPAQGYSLTAKPPTGASFGSATVSGINITGDASVTITLVPLVTLSGKVTGPLGNPLAGITVDLGSFIMTTTNASGNYSISTPAANYPVKVRGGDSTGAQHLPSGFDMQTLSNFALTQNTTLDIPLNFTKRVTVHVQDPLGNSVANTVINTGSSPYNNNLSIGPLPAQGRSEYYDGGAVTNVTNASGDAVLWLFPAQSYNLTAKPPTGSPYTPFTVSNVSINADKTIVIALSYACQALTVNPATIPAGAVGATYSQVFTQTGGTGSTTFSLSGALPTGLSFTGNKLEGMPQQSGSFPITVIALDQNQCAGIRDYILNICSTITVNPSTVAAGTVGVPYNQVFTQTSGAGMVHFMFSGLMPDGLNFSGNTLAGLPSTPGTYNFTITATDANGCTGMRGYTLTVNCQPITVNPPTIPAGAANTPYSQIFTQTSGAGTVHFMFSGLMPDGLDFSGNTLAGAPSTPGTYNFTITATDANGCTGMRDYTLNVACVNDPIVANNADSGAGSLRQAIASACAGSTITFANTVASPITLASELAINKNLTIQGPGANLLCISGNNVNRVFYIAPAAAVTIDKLTITQGYGGEVIVGNLLVARGGGGIFNQGNLTLTNSTVTDNTANGGGDGGGIYNLNGTVAISHSTISNNTTSYYGGGIFNNGNAPAVLTLTDSTVSGNSTGGFRGGGIVNVAGQATLTNSTVSGNTSTGQGAGGLWNWIGGTLTLINSTVSGNTGNGYSGGIRNTGSTLILINSTVSGNRDIDGSYSWVAGGIGNDSGPVTIKNSIIANNTINAINSSSDCAGSITSQGYNLIKNTSGATITPAQPTDIFGADPLLGPLASNGGPTQTMELLPGSPAIDKGSAVSGVTTDQRGQMRPMDFPFIANATGGNGADIGAFETQTLPNLPPVINGYNITRQQGSPGVAETIAVVSDDYTPAGAMNVIPLNSIAGITITNILNTNGAITANVAADCTAPLGNNAILLQVTDGSGLARTSNLGINVTANTPAALGVYPPAGTINVSASATVMPNAVPSDNGTISSIIASAPGFTGSFSVDSATGIVTISNAGPAGNYVVTVTATDDCGTTASKTFSLAVACPGATIIVTGAADGPLAALAGNGRCDLREAVTAANTNTAVGECPAGVPGLDTIYFALGTSPPIINVTGSELPAITEPVVLDGASCQSARVELNGVGVVAGGTNGLTVTAGGSTIRGLVINRFRNHGIRIDTGGGNVIENCFIGTDASGTLDRGNGGNGIFINASSNNRIGGTSPGQRNLISGNDQVGLELTVLGTGSNANNNVIQGNFIGTDVSGTQAIGNIRDGIFLSAINASLNVIGGTTAGASNLISGNGQSGSGAGIALFSSENQVLGNLIGTDITNNLPLGNYDGIRIRGDQNVIGGTAPGAANFIGYSGNQGVWISNGTRNSILSNSIFSNSALGIDLGQFGVTPNDVGDGDTGGNDLQNFPILAFATPTSIQGALNSTANTAFTVQLFSNFACDSLGNGEGRTYLGQLTNVTTDGGGNASFNFSPAAALTVGAFITATATDPDGNTSEFSACRIVTATPPPTLSINDRSVTEGSSGSVNAVFTVSLSAPSTQTVTVQIATADGTAISPGTGPFADYVPPNIQMLTFPPNTLTQTFTVPVLGDTTFEPNETFFVNLSSPANATLAKAIGQGIISNDDGPPLLSITNATVTEGNGGTIGAVFTVILSNASYQPITVQYATADDTATAPSDYVAQPLTTLTFPAHTNILTKIITVPVKGDTTIEPNETLFVNLSNPTPGNNVTVIDNQGLGTILNDDNCPTPIANAGPDQTKKLLPFGQPPPVTLNGTASSNPGGGTLTYQWRKGATVVGSSAILTVNLPLGTHIFDLTVTNQCFAQATDTVVINIITCPTIPITPATGPNGTVGTPYNQPLTATGGIAPYTFSLLSTGLPPGLSLSPAGVLTNTPTQAGTYTFTVGVTDSIGCTGSVTYTITIIGPTVSINDATVTEGNSGTVNAVFTVGLSIPIMAPVTVQYATADGTATAPSDYIALPLTTLTFPPNTTTQTITVQVKGDTASEPDETFFINLSAPASATLADGQGVGTIRNDDCPAFAFLTKWGSQGAGNGQFNINDGVAVDTAGNVYVADRINHRVQKFDANGNFLLKWGTNGTGNGQFNQLWDLAVDTAGNVYVADYDNHRIQKFDANGNFLLKWGSFGTGNGQFNRPFGIAVSAAGQVYVTDTQNSRIQKFDALGNFLLQWGSSGAANGQFVNPFGVEVSPAGEVYVADRGNNRIQKFDANGAFLLKWGSSGTGDGQFMSAVGVGVNLAGQVFITDGAAHRIQQFDANGNFLFKWGSFGTGDGQFNQPFGASVNSSGQVYIADSVNHRVQKFSLPPSPIANAGPDQNLTIISGVIPVTLNGTASSSPNGGPLTYQWRKGAMVLGSGATLTVTLPAGTHTITLVVTDQCGLPAYDTVVIKIGKNIFTGTNVTAQIDPVAVTFANVAAAGAVFVNSIVIDEAGVKVTTSKAAFDKSLAPTLNGTSALPNGYSVFDQFAYDVSTTATVSGPVTTCFNEPTAASSAVFASLRVLHEEGGALVDRTILPPGSPAPDFNTRTVCARTNTLGLFVVARLLNIPPVLSYASPQTVISGQTSIINPNNGPSDSNGNVASIVVQSVTPGFGGSVIVNNTTGVVTVSNPAPLGSYLVTIRATDNDGAATDASFTLNVTCPAVTLPASPLVAGQAGVSYSASVAALPAGTYTYSLLAGSLPSGLTLNTVTGLLSGMPTATGTYNFTVKAQAANGCGGTQAYALSINCPAITLSALPTPLLNTAYNQTVMAAPAGGNYSFAVTAGSLPAGLALNPATGGLSGTPASSGTFTFTIRATGFGGCTGSKSYTVVIGGGSCPAITLPASLPGGSVGSLYSNSATASPSGSYSYMATGALPPGVTLYSSVGLLFGYPTTKGTFTFTITATGSNNCTGSKQYTVVIGGAGLLALAVNDFNGDRRSDFVLWGEAKAQWLILDSATDQARTMQWGKAGDVAAPGDYDGDGKADLAVFGKDGHWLIRLSKDGATVDTFWGLETDAPVPGDYDGDGKTDIAVWRGAEGVWYILRSSDGQTQTVQWGTSLAPCFDVPVPGDYDGDGKTDVAVFRQANGHWYIRRSSDGQTVDHAWGVGTDIPVPGDYDGDGSTDIAVWRGAEGAWYIIKSGDGVAETKMWGAAYEPYFDAPAVGDYDGDGKADIAVWRKPEGRWHILQSSDGAARVVTQGRTGDKVVTVTPRR